MITGNASDLLSPQSISSKQPLSAEVGRLQTQLQDALTEVKKLKTQLAFTLTENEQLRDRNAFLHSNQEFLQEQWNQYMSESHREPGSPFTPREQDDRSVGIGSGLAQQVSAEESSYSEAQQEGGQQSDRPLSIGNLAAYKDKLDENAAYVQSVESKLDQVQNLNLVLSQMNQFNNALDKKKDNDLFNKNFQLKEEIVKKDNIIEALQDEIVKLKRTLRESGNAPRVELVDNYVFDPIPEVIEILRKQTQGEQAIRERAIMKEKLERLLNRQKELETDLIKQQNLAQVSMKMLSKSDQDKEQLYSQLQKLQDDLEAARTAQQEQAPVPVVVAPGLEEVQQMVYSLHHKLDNMPQKMVLEVPPDARQVNVPSIPSPNFINKSSSHDVVHDEFRQYQQPTQQDELDAHQHQEAYGQEEYSPEEQYEERPDPHFQQQHQQQQQQYFQPDPAQPEQPEYYQEEAESEHISQKPVGGLERFGQPYEHHPAPKRESENKFSSYGQSVQQDKVRLVSEISEPHIISGDHVSNRDQQPLEVSRGLQSSIDPNDPYQSQKLQDSREKAPSTMVIERDLNEISRDINKPEQHQRPQTDLDQYPPDTISRKIINQDSKSTIGGSLERVLVDRGIDVTNKLPDKVKMDESHPRHKEKVPSLDLNEKRSRKHQQAAADKAKPPAEVAPAAAKLDQPPKVEMRPGPQALGQSSTQELLNESSSESERMKRIKAKQAQQVTELRLQQEQAAQQLQKPQKPREMVPTLEDIKAQPISEEETDAANEVSRNVSPKRDFASKESQEVEMINQKAHPSQDEVQNAYGVPTSHPQPPLKAKQTNMFEPDDDESGSKEESKFEHQTVKSLARSVNTHKTQKSNKTVGTVKTHKTAGQREKTSEGFSEFESSKHTVAQPKVVVVSENSENVIKVVRSKPLDTIQQQNELEMLRQEQLLREQAERGFIEDPLSSGMGTSMPSEPFQQDPRMVGHPMLDDLNDSGGIPQNYFHQPDHQQTEGTEEVIIFEESEEEVSNDDYDPSKEQSHPLVSPMNNQLKDAVFKQGMPAPSNISNEYGEEYESEEDEKDNQADPGTVNQAVGGYMRSQSEISSTNEEVIIIEEEEEEDDAGVSDVFERDENAAMGMTRVGQQLSQVQVVNPTQVARGAHNPQNSVIFSEDENLGKSLVKTINQDTGLEDDAEYEYIYEEEEEETENDMVPGRSGATGAGGSTLEEKPDPLQQIGLPPRVGQSRPSGEGEQEFKEYIDQLNASKKVFSENSQKSGSTQKWKTKQAANVKVVKQKNSIEISRVSRSKNNSKLTNKPSTRNSESKSDDRQAAAVATFQKQESSHEVEQIQKFDPSDFDMPEEKKPEEKKKESSREEQTEVQAFQPLTESSHREEVKEDSNRVQAFEPLD